MISFKIRLHRNFTVRMAQSIVNYHLIKWFWVDTNYWHTPTDPVINMGSWYTSVSENCCRVCHIGLPFQSVHENIWKNVHKNQPQKMGPGPSVNLVRQLQLFYINIIYNWSLHYHHLNLNVYLKVNCEKNSKFIFIIIYKMFSAKCNAEKMANNVYADHRFCPGNETTSYKVVFNIRV